ncbi:fused MFS/spermidine synthase [Aquabacterium sp.]|uniref:fused MFS/spermidine synthase n=1 Tax=Aquabacterium sp. TaxID=1872578 RepID=UPI0027BAE63D|nr:fused MFS/spermidine synthase [Aquabacterium sp.]
MSEQAKLHQNSQTLSLSFESSLIQSCMSLADPDELVLDYTRAMMGFLLLNPAPRSVLMIGLGGGALHKYIHKHLPETDLTTVEINPGVIELRQDFCIPPDDERSRIFCADGAAFLAKPTHQFDVILVDGFTGDGIPDALCSPGFYRRVKAALAPQGVMVANVQADTEQTRDIMKRVGRVFDGGTLSFESDEGGNDIVLAASQDALNAAAQAFEPRWDALPEPHKVTLAAASTRLQRALLKSLRPS